MPSYTRPGVAAAVRLAVLDGPNKISVWEQIEARYDDMILKTGGDKLVELEKFCTKLSKKIVSSDEPVITKEELLKIVDWKFTKGKPRYALLNRLKSNQNVEECSRKAFIESMKGNVQEAINGLCALNGVGPATASAVLTLHRGDLFAFMDDEVIEAVYDGKRGYTFKIFDAVNSKCNAIAKQLGENWTTRRVGRALWAASRLCASGEKDLTLERNSGAEKEAKRSVAKRGAFVADADEDEKDTDKHTRGSRKRTRC